MAFIYEENRIFANNEKGELVAELTFPNNDQGGVTIDHTFISEKLRGRGAAAALLNAAYDYLKNRGKKVKPLCPYAVRWFERNPDKNDILQK